MVKKNEKPKSAKEVQKELEERMFGMKNKKKSKEIKKQLEKIEVAKILERKKKQQEISERVTLVQPKAPVGVDSKTIPCVYYINKMCTKGDSCKYMHEKKPIIQETEKVEEDQNTKLVCRFLIDAISQGQLMSNWKCPNTKCTDIHKLTEIGDTEISLEEFIELSRQTLKDDEPLLNEETFKQWLEQREKEQRLHSERVDALKKGISGADLFKERPECFVDDEEAADVDYNDRDYDDDEDDILKKFDNLGVDSKND